MDYIYARQKLNEARRALMLPHSRGEAHSIAQAFFAISLGIGEPALSDIPDDFRDHVRTLLEYMDVSKMTEPEDRWRIKAEGFTTDDKIAISSAVDQLCFWFDEYVSRKR